MRPSVENIPDNVKMIHRQIGNCLRHRHDEAIRDSAFYNRTDNRFIIVIFVRLVIRVQQFVHRIGQISGQTLTDFGAGIFCGHRLTNRNKAIYHSGAPFVEVSFAFMAAFKLRLRIIDQCRKIISVLLAENPSVVFVDFHPDRPRRTLQHMDERLMFSMQITQEIFRALRQRQNRIQVYDLCRCRFQIRIVLSQKFQIL